MEKAGPVSDDRSKHPRGLKASSRRMTDYAADIPSVVLRKVGLTMPEFGK